MPGHVPEGALRAVLDVLVRSATWLIRLAALGGHECCMATFASASWGTYIYDHMVA